MATAAPKGSIFRSKALQNYVQSREKNVLPRLVAPPVFAFFWVILAMLTAAGLVAWLGQVPLYVTGSGLVLDQSATTAQGKKEAVAVILLPATSSMQSMHLQAGMPVQVQVGSNGPPLMRTIDSVEPGILSPSVVHQRYMLGVSEPSFVATVGLPDISSQLYAGSPVQAQIQIGSQPLLSLFFDTHLKGA